MNRFGAIFIVLVQGAALFALVAAAIAAGYLLRGIL